MSDHFLTELNRRFRANPDAERMEFGGRAFTGGQLVEAADTAIGLLAQAGLSPSQFTAVIVRNRPLVAAAMLGLITSERPLRTVYSYQSPAAIAQDIAEFAAVIAESQDWSPELIEAVRSNGGVGIVLDLEAPVGVSFLPGASQLAPTTSKGQPWRTCDGEKVLEMLSSGTTGKPKPVRFPFRLLERAVLSSTGGRDSPEGFPPNINIWPLGGIGGVCNLTSDAWLGRHCTLLERFAVPEWVAAVRKRQPHYVAATTTTLRMIYDAGVPPEDLACIKRYWGGSMHLPADFEEAFEKRYNAQIIWQLGATEFCGTILSWTPELKEQFGVSKRGAVGKAFGGASVRIVDPDSGEPVPAGTVGLIEACVPAVGPDWIRTTDLAVMDEDGFVFHRGRGDGAIVRGGFKIIPEKVAEAISSHPAVLDCAVVGSPDPRLGEVPVAYVELARGAVLAPDELSAHVQPLLPTVQHPVAFFILEQLPRTPSLKVSLAALRERVSGDLAANR